MGGGGVVDGNTCHREHQNDPSEKNILESAGYVGVDEVTAD